MSEAPSLVGSRLTIRLNSASLWVIFVVAIGGALTILGLGIATVVSNLATSTATLTLQLESKLPDASLVGGGAGASGTYDTALVNLKLHPDALGLVVASNLTGTLVAVSLWALVALLAWRLLHGRALRKSLATSVSLAGAILIIGGMIETGTAGIAAGLAAASLDDAGHTTFWPLATTFDYTSTGVGFLLLVIGLVFEYGARLQKETEGLV